MDASRAPKKIRASHIADQLASLDGDPGAPTSRATMRSILPNQSDTVTVPHSAPVGKLRCRKAIISQSTLRRIIASQWARMRDGRFGSDSEELALSMMSPLDPEQPA
jgi:hypothetical protein